MTADFILGECFNFTAEDDFFRPLTPEIPPPLPPQPRDCRFCGCTCQIISDSYRLVNLFEKLSYFSIFLVVEKFLVQKFFCNLNNLHELRN